MLSTNQGELPTNKKNRSNLDAVRHQLFHHYLNHSYRDIPNSNLTSSKKVIEGIIEQFSKKYRPEKYFRNSEGLEDQISYNTKDDSLEDIRSVAHIAVWEATEKYIVGVNKTVDGKIIQIEYNTKFLFCQFASSQVKFKLRTYLRKQNLDRVCGYAPDSDNIRKIYTILPQIKFEKGNIDEKDFLLLSNKIENLSKEDIKAFDKLITARTISGDEEKQDEEGNTFGNWDNLASDKNNPSLSYNHENGEDNIDDKIENTLINEEFNNLKYIFISQLPLREREILTYTKFKEFNNLEKEFTLSDLGKKFSISAEAVRKISDKRFIEFQNFIKKNKKRLGR